MKFTMTVLSLLGTAATFAAALPATNAPAAEVRAETVAAGYSPNDRGGGEDIAGTVGDTVDGAFGIAGDWVQLVANLIGGGHGRPGYGGGYGPGNGGYGGGQPY